MVLDFKTYRDKVLGCWMGKNIGGVLGAPFEGIRQFTTTWKSSAERRSCSR